MLSKHLNVFSIPTEYLQSKNRIGPHRPNSPSLGQLFELVPVLNKLIQPLPDLLSPHGSLVSQPLCHIQHILKNTPPPCHITPQPLPIYPQFPGKKCLALHTLWLFYKLEVLEVVLTILGE